MKWHQHFLALSVAPLVIPLPAPFAAIGGVLFGVGATWWYFGRPWGHSLSAWWEDATA